MNSNVSCSYMTMSSLTYILCFSVRFEEYYEIKITSKCVAQKFELKWSSDGPLSKLCVTPPFSINFRCQIENQVSDYRHLEASSLVGCYVQMKCFYFVLSLCFAFCKFHIVEEFFFFKVFKHIFFTNAYEWDWATGYAYTSSLLFTCTRHTFRKEYVTIISIIKDNYVPSIHVIISTIDTSYIYIINLQVKWNL